MMKHAVALCLFSSTLALLAPSAMAGPHAKKAKRARVVKLSRDKPTGVVIVAEPAKAEGSTAAPKRARASYWMASDPHVPLAVVDGRQIRGVGKRGKDCGNANRWASPKSRWRAVDEWGQITGTFVVARSETFDLTQCREVTFAPSGKVRAGLRLFVSDDSGYRPRESAAFTPSGVEKKRFERFLNAVESAFVDHKPRGKYVPWGHRTMFFEVSMPRDPDWEGRVDGAGKAVVRPRRWAVSGGPVLTVSYLGHKGQWHAAKVLPPLGLTDSYKPVAVFDMNGDGIPEIVYQSGDGATFADAVMALDPKALTWSEAAESPGGAAL
jgi:hypothetical protein